MGKIFKFLAKFNNSYIQNMYERLKSSKKWIQKMSTSDEIDIFHKYVYIYTKGLFGDNRYIVPLMIISLGMMSSARKINFA